MIRSEKTIWNKVKAIMGNKVINLGEHWSYNLHNDPKRLAFVLSRYKFSAKMASKGKSILELGCSEGIGTPILAEFAEAYTGVDMDKDAIITARKNWGSERIKFMDEDFLGRNYGTFDVVVSLDMVGRVARRKERTFFKTLYDNLADDGLAVIGTPNMTSAPYASRASRFVNVNQFGYERIRAVMMRYFRTVFVFGMSDEIVHFGYLPMAHYLLCVGCGKRKRPIK